MNIGFTGTRHGMTELQLCLFEGLLGKITSFHHGSCRGVDVEAARIVRKSYSIHIPIICHLGPDGDSNQEDSGVDDEKLPGKSHFARNRDIVNACDELIACPFDNEEQTKGGTWYTVNYARKQEKKIVIIWPDGRLE